MKKFLNHQAQIRQKKRCRNFKNNGEIKTKKSKQKSKQKKRDIVCPHESCYFTTVQFLSDEKKKKLEMIYKPDNGGIPSRGFHNPAKD